MSNIKLNQKIENLKAYAKSADITYEAIYERSGIPVSTLKKIFSGKTINPRLDTVEAIERALGINSTPQPENNLSEQEREIISMYRGLPEKLKQLVFDQLVALSASKTYCC